MKRKALRLGITGCRTLVASRLLDDLSFLEPVERIVVFDVQPPVASDARIEFYQTDLTSPGVDASIAEVLIERKIDTFLHAAFLWDPVRDAHWVHDLESVGTDWVLAAIQAAKVRKLVVTSSVSLYGIGHRLPIPIKEDTPLEAEQTIPPFRDKVTAEKAVANFASTHPEVCVTVLRSAIALGADVDRIVPRYLRRKFIPVLAGFDPLVQFIHPDDIVAAYRRCLLEDHPGVFNITTPDAVALSDVLKIGRRIPVPVFHPVAQYCLSALWTAGIVDIHPAYLDFMRFSAITDGTKAREEIGFVPSRNTIDTVVEFYRRLDGKA